MQRYSRELNVISGRVGMVEDPEGCYVLFEDHVAAMQQQRLSAVSVVQDLGRFDHNDDFNSWAHGWNACHTAAIHALQAGRDE